jgi:uncharacterized membrane protein YqaE (UPF0057 family)
MKYILAIFLPPMAVLMCGRPGAAVVNFFLTLLFWIPGIIHAWVTIGGHHADQRTDRLVATMARGGHAGGAATATAGTGVGRLAGKWALIMIGCVFAAIAIVVMVAISGGAR